MLPTFIKLNHYFLYLCAVLLQLQTICWDYLKIQSVMNWRSLMFSLKPSEKHTQANFRIAELTRADRI